jgi:hypothetical protein
MRVVSSALQEKFGVDFKSHKFKHVALSRLLGQAPGAAGAGAGAVELLPLPVRGRDTQKYKYKYKYKIYL